MLLMNDILSDKEMDRHERIDKLEAILSAVSTMDESVSLSRLVSLFVMTPIINFSFIYHSGPFRRIVVIRQFV